MTVDAGGNVAGYDDYDPYGQILPGRSSNNGLADPKYKLRHPSYEIYLAEIPPLAGFTGKERDVETSLDYFGARYYDSWRGQWLSVDPMAEKYPGWSPYSYGADNPIKFIDADGRWIYIANLGRGTANLYNLPYGPNGKAFYNVASSGGYDKRYIDLPEEHLEIRDRLNSYYGDYRTVAPKVADYLKNTMIAVALYSAGPKEEEQGFSDWRRSGGIGLSAANLDKPDRLKVLLFHELVHTMLKSDDEFSVFAASFAAGYENEKSITGHQWEYWQFGMEPKRWGKYFDDNHQLKKDTANEFWKEFKEYGNEINGNR